MIEISFNLIPEIQIFILLIVYFDLYLTIIFSEIINYNDYSLRYQ